MTMNDELKYVAKQVGIVFLVILLGLLVFAIGLVIGYGVIGGGHNPWSILSPDKWQSIINKFTGK